MSQNPQNNATTIIDYAATRSATTYQYDATGLVDVNQLENYFDTLHRGTTTQVEMFIEMPHTVGQYANHVGNLFHTMWTNGDDNTAGQDIDRPFGQMQSNSVRYVGDYVYDSVGNIQQVSSPQDNLPPPEYGQPSSWTEVSGVTSPSECDPCSGPFIETWAGSWASDSTFNPQTGVLRSANQSYRYKVTYRRPGHLDPNIFSLPQVTNDEVFNEPVDIQEVTAQEVRFKTEEASCVCCCCSCAQEPSVAALPSPPCTGGMVVSGIPFRRGQQCTGVRTWASDVLCPVCVYPTI